MKLRRIAALAGLAAAAACSSGGSSGGVLNGGGSGGAGGSSGVGGIPGFDAGGVDLTACMAKTDAFTADSLLAAYDTPETDDFDIPLSPAGCWRIRGNKTHQEVVREEGDFTYGYDPVTQQPTLILEPRVLSKRDVSTSGIHVETDGDEDGFFEWRQDLAYDAQGVWQSRKDQTYSATTQALVSEVDTTAVSSSSRHVVQKALEAGQLVVAQEYDATVPQENCYPPAATPPNCDWQETQCSPAQTQALRDALAQALLKSSTCIPGYHNVNNLTGFMLPRIHFQCRTGKCARGAQTDGPFGSVILNIDVSETGASDLSTIVFHELSHTYLPSHDPALVNSAGPVGLQYQVDQVYACQAYCFAPAPNRCFCARCLGVKTCDYPCGDLPTCDKPALNRIYGQTATETAGYCQADGKVCDTMADCKSGCSDGSSCKNLSLNCDPTCQ